MESKVRKVAILTNGGDAPGLNAVIRAIVKTARTYGVECYGFIEGYKGLLNNDYVKLDLSTNASGLLTKGGTIIGTSNNTNVFNYKCINEDGSVEYKDLSDQCVENIKNDGFDCLFTLGGDGTQKSSRDFSLKGINCIGVPKTIDNDVAHTDMTFGYSTAVSIATEAIDRLHTTAESHHRIMILEVMGRYAGWIALESGIAGGADVILIPEIPYDINSVLAKINERRNRGKEFTIIVVSEGAKPKDGDITVRQILNDGSGLDNVRLGGVGEKLAVELEQLTGMGSRNTTLGYVQRGGAPCAFDRALSTRYGVKAMELAMEGTFNVLVNYKDGKMGSVPLEDVIGDNKVIGAASGNTKESNIRKIPMDHPYIDICRKMGVSLGD